MLTNAPPGVTPSLKTALLGGGEGKKGNEAEYITTFSHASLHPLKYFKKKQF